MNPYYAVKDGKIAIEVEEGDTMLHFSVAETEYVEAIIDYIMQVADEKHKPMLQMFLDRISVTPQGLVH